METKKHTLKEWIIATRPWSFPASLMPVLVTIAYLYWAVGEINLLFGIWALVGIVLFHAGGNTWSDYYDYQKGVDADDTFGAKTLTDKQFLPQEIRKLSILLLTVATLSGLALVYYTGLSLLWIGLLGALGTVLYPYLKFHALGDLLIFVLYGVLPALGTSYVTVGAFRWETLWVVVPVALITVGILHINNTRDIHTDGRAGISTMAMLMGRKSSAYAYMAEMLVPFVWIAVSVILFDSPYCTLLTWLALPVAMGNVRAAAHFLKQGNEPINFLDERTAQLQLLFSLIYSISFVISRFIEL